MKRIAKSLALCTAIVLAQAANASACPMCKYALESDPQEPQAYMVSILFMMGMIMSLFLAVAVALWWVVRQDKLSLDAAGYQHLFENAGNQPHLVSATKQS